LQAAQVSALTSADIIALRTDQAQALTTQQVVALTTAQVLAMETQDFASLSTSARKQTGFRTTAPRFQVTFALLRTSWTNLRASTSRPIISCAI
jgi:hypothetical protein